jgi:hypothetical protein
MAKKAILQGKEVEYRRVYVNDNVEKHYGILTEDSFYEKIPNNELPELPGHFWFRKWDVTGKKLINPSVPFPIEKSMRRGKLHVLLNGEWVRANKTTTHILFKGENNDKN